MANRAVFPEKAIQEAAKRKNHHHLSGQAQAPQKETTQMSDLIITPEFIESLLAKLNAAPVPAPAPYRPALVGQFIPHQGTVYSMEHLSPTERRFVNLRTKAVYEMAVTVESKGKQATVTGTVNGERAYHQSWIIDVRGAMYYSFEGNLPNIDAAVSGAFDCMMAKLPS